MIVWQKKCMYAEKLQQNAKEKLGIFSIKLLDVGHLNLKTYCKVGEDRVHA